ncbi:MAG: DNA mismatch repair endonuclease MutL [Brumimicrobium sp.]
MSDIIHLLPDNIANQIAAGEVIQRPASVVKELIENAVDSGATKIELHIKGAGKTSIQVIDDGKGMSEMDAQMSFERHATSKLKTADDLFSLQTKGFRGEALASIAAIAHVTMETIEEKATVGTKIEIAGSKITSKEPCTRLKGTSITVKNLFFNVPARRNFLKSENVETKHIVEEFNRIALTHPEINFVFSHDGNIINSIESANQRKRIVDLFGRKFNEKLVPIEEETDIVNIYGFVGKPEFSRKTRGEQYFFVNNRYFKSRYLHHAVSKAYENLLSSSQYPSYFIYLEVPPKSLDVNIHPTKTEVKFENEKFIYQILLSTIKLALGKFNIAPSLDFEREAQFDLTEADRKRPINEPTIEVNPYFNPFEDSKPHSSKTFSRPGNSSIIRGLRPLQPNREEWENFYKITEEGEHSKNQELEFDENQSFNTQKIQVHKRYLLTQIKSGLLLIHINRANERILYDELSQNFMLNPISSQQMLFPYEYEFQNTQKLEWDNNKDMLKRLGFEWQWNKKTLVLSSIPSILNIEAIPECLDDILEKITQQEIDKGEIVHELILSLSSSATRNSSKKLTEEEMNYLIERLFQSEQHQYSPSGKRIMNTITIDNLNKFLL